MSLKIAVVGTNFISDAFCDAAKQLDDVFVTAVYSRKLDTGAAFAQKHGIKTVYESFDEMLADEEIGAVYIASPTFTHKELAIRAMTAGKHVLCEKSISVTLDEFLQMKRASGEAGVVLLEAMRPAFDPLMSILKEQLSRLGQVRSAGLEFCQYSRRYDGFKSGILTNAFDPKMKNSALTDIGIYPLHIAVSLFGEPISLSASSTFLHNGFEGEGEVRLDYQSFEARISYSKVRQGENISQIECEGGILCFDKPNAPSSIALTDKSGALTRLSYEPTENNMVYEIAAFRDMIEGRKSHLPYLSVTEKVMRTVDRIYEAAGIKFPE